MPIEERFWYAVNKTPDCWLWTGTNTGGKWPYGNIRADVNGRWRYIKAHRVSFEIHYGPIHPGIGLLVLHKCDNTLCVRPDHLFLGTYKDNTTDMRVKHRDNFFGGAARPWRKQPARPQRACLHCADLFTVPRMNKTQKYCCHRCSTNARIK